MMDPAEAPNLNYAWCGLLVEELIRQGVAGFVISPGSRNAPLTVSVARNERARYWMHFDERGAAFFALGLAKATGQPAVLICTSGSATANYWPAVVEADASGIPLIIVTADRPPELLDCGANQAIKQSGLYGSYVRWETTLPCPTPDIEPSYVLTTVDQAISRSKAANPGPVHLNCMLREPLAPNADGTIPDHYFDKLSSWESRAEPYTVYGGGCPTLTNEEQAHLLKSIQSCHSGLLVFGALTTVDETAQAASLARKLGWPVFADVCAGLRGYPEIPTLLDQGDLVLLDDTLTDEWSPDLVVHVGAPLTSKRDQTFIERVRPEYIRVCNTPLRKDPVHLVTLHATMEPAPFCAWLVTRDGIDNSVPIPDALRERNVACFDTLETWENSNYPLSEIGAARLVAEHSPCPSLIFLGNSMPVRLVNSFGYPTIPDVQVAANRGASGIDGNIATAAGMALASNLPTTALVGDLTLLHDLNSLALLQHLKSPFVVVVLNNDGGGIFHHLPIAGQDDVFEECFGTPHGLDFHAAATLFNIAYEQPVDMPEFATIYGAARERPDPTLIEVVIDRQASHAGHVALTNQLRDAMKTRKA
jgi:2-succinyl-5-enolpyruvyl-6-hydroxy-3-cyclohexene-1-carboxylate synthase